MNSEVKRQSLNPSSWRQFCGRSNVSRLLASRYLDNRDGHQDFLFYVQECQRLRPDFRWMIVTRFWDFRLFDFYFHATKACPNLIGQCYSDYKWTRNRNQNLLIPKPRLSPSGSAFICREEADLMVCSFETSLYTMTLFTFHKYLMQNGFQYFRFNVCWRFRSRSMNRSQFLSVCQSWRDLFSYPGCFVYAVNWLIKGVQVWMSCQMLKSKYCCKMPLVRVSPTLRVLTCFSFWHVLGWEKK